MEQEHLDLEVTNWHTY